MLSRRASKPRLLVVSHVLPFPRAAGQNQRVYYTLVGLRKRFHLTFLTFEPETSRAETRRKLLGLVDEAIVMPSALNGSALSRFWRRVKGLVYSITTGLKSSNYVIGEVEFKSQRIEQFVDLRQFDLALFEYWHAWKLSKTFRKLGVPTVLDMHDVLWRSYERSLQEHSRAPQVWRQFALKRYRQAEEQSWSEFDAVIGINREEEEYARNRVSSSVEMFYAPMGTDLTFWPYSPERPQPQRLAFYGGMSTPRNQDSAKRCAERIMPLVWQRFPDVEFWIVGSKPPESIVKLSQNPKIKVTGFVDNVQAILRTMTAILCPWSGAFGFRSRLIEAMALGSPVVATPDAAAGMELEHLSGVLYGENDRTLADWAIRLLEDDRFSREQSGLARSKVEALYSFEATYGVLTEDLQRWMVSRKTQEEQGGGSDL